MRSVDAARSTVAPKRPSLEPKRRQYPTVQVLAWGQGRRGGTLRHTHGRTVTGIPTKLQEGDRKSGIPDRLRSFIRFRGQPIRQFATEAQIPYSTLQDYLSGKSRPGADHLLRMAALGLNVDWLLTGRLPFRYQGPVNSADEAASVVGADERFVGLLEEEAFKAADQYMERRRAKGASALTARETHIVVAYYLQLMIRRAATLPKDIVDLSYASIGVKVIVEMSAQFITPDLDLRIDEIVASEADSVRKS